MKTQRIMNAVVALCAAVAVPGIVSAVAVSGQGTWETTLQGRDLDGNLATAEAYYDTVLNITWLADTNYSGISMDWAPAIAWAAALDPYSSGITGWRLPNTDPVNGTDYSGDDFGWNISAPGTLYAGSTASEMAHLYYNTLGNLSPYFPSGEFGQPGAGLTNTGPFSNIHVFDEDGYWSATEWSDTAAWYFYFVNGYQDITEKTDVEGDRYSWAVHDGDVGIDCTSFNCGPMLIVAIDVKPGSKTNAVNPRTNGKIKVAILTSETLDAGTVDVGTLQFGPGSGTPVWHRLDDVDHDGDWDLVLKFDTQDTDIACGDTEATLTGRLFNGVQITGTDSIKTTGCKNN